MSLRSSRPPSGALHRFMPPANSARHTPEHTPHVRGTCSVLLRGCCALACSSTSECCAHQLHSLTMRTAYKSGSISWQVCALSLVASDHPCCQDLESSCRCETHRPVSTSASRQSQPIAKMTVVACIPYALPCACARPRTVPTAAWRRRRDSPTCTRVYRIWQVCIQGVLHDRARRCASGVPRGFG